jgi:hypothetical protein
VDPGLSVPNCQAFTQVFVKQVLRIRIGFNAELENELYVNADPVLDPGI